MSSVLFTGACAHPDTNRMTIIPTAAIEPRIILPPSSHHVTTAATLCHLAQYCNFQLLRHAVTKSPLMMVVFVISQGNLTAMGENRSMPRLVTTQLTLGFPDSGVEKCALTVVNSAFSPCYQENRKQSEQLHPFSGRVLSRYKYSDIALYHAKENGRNRVEMHGEQDPEIELF
ncbi:MAG: hypothetical protein Q9M26_01215 [Mariprofundales bacterium]|nr:hypothetical protein [Mariprofundales bacterium]